jgi:hypothetical protein
MALCKGNKSLLHVSFNWSFEMAFTLRHWRSHSGAADVPSVLGCDGVFVQAVADILKKQSAFVFSLEQSKKTSCATNQNQPEN